MVSLWMLLISKIPFFFFFNDTATTEIYTLSLHDALPISWRSSRRRGSLPCHSGSPARKASDRKSTRLNSSHLGISYAVFCLKKKKKKKHRHNEVNRKSRKRQDMQRRQVYGS